MTTQHSPQLHIAETVDLLRLHTATFVIDAAARSIAERGRFSVAFSGGSLPGLIGPSLISHPLAREIQWASWQIFFADERCVPLADVESNYRLLREHLLDHVPIPTANIHPIQENMSPKQAAKSYASLLGAMLHKSDAGWPVFDLILLGMGPDGHTASLFPNHSLLQENVRWVAAILDAPKPPPQRITLTLPALNSARRIAFIVTGASKAEALAQALTPATVTPAVPASLVRPISSELHWFLDREAAQQIAAPGYGMLLDAA